MQMLFYALSYRLPANPSRNRVHIWKELKQLGAVYLQQGVALLPKEEALEKELQHLYDEIFSFDGNATLAELSFVNEKDLRAIRCAFIEKCNDEYKELLSSAQRIINGLKRMQENRHFLYAELEEHEMDFKKLKRWLGKIKNRDYFHADKALLAEESLKQVENALQEYAAFVYSNENTGE